MASIFPRYAVLWTGRTRTAPVVFYRFHTRAGYNRLARHLAQYSDWETSFTWSSRRFAGYRRELVHKGVTCLTYEETRKGWKLATALTPSTPRASVGTAALFAPNSL